MALNKIEISVEGIQKKEFEIDQMMDADNRNKKSAYNYPGYKPVRSELRHAPVKISGQLPLDLEGVYLRNGTNIQFDKPKVRIHAFAGAGMVHQIQIKGGVATYSNTYIRTPRFEEEKKAGREIYMDFSDVATGGQAAWKKMLLIEEKKRAGLLPDLNAYEISTGSTSIRYHAGHLYCLQEQGYAFMLNTKKENGRLVLDGTGHYENWEGEWDGPFSAHPRVDPRTSDMYNISMQPSGRVVAGHITNGLRHSQATVNRCDPRERTGWLHDFFLTENYLIYADISMRRTDMKEGLHGPKGSIYFWDPDYLMRWAVFPRYYKEGDQVRWFTTKSVCAIWHVINGWERISDHGSPEIVLYSPCFTREYPSSVPIHTPEEPAGQVRKWILNLETGECEEELLIDAGYERPSLNLRYVSEPSQYCYLLDEHARRGDGYMGKGVLKFDMFNDRELEYLSYGDMYGGEALFVPRKNATSEDDGYLLDLLVDGRGNEPAQLLIMDAKNMTEICRLHLPQRVPFGVHACWLEPEDLASLGVL